MMFLLVLPMIGLVTCLWHNSPRWEKMPEVPEEGFYQGQCCFSSPWTGHVWMWHLELLHLSWNHIISQTKIKSIWNITVKKDLKKLLSSVILLVSLQSKSGTLKPWINENINIFHLSVLFFTFTLIQYSIIWNFLLVVNTKIMDNAVLSI